MIKITLQKLKKWFDLRLGWVFVNGRNQEAWIKHLKDKYGDSFN